MLNFLRKLRRNNMKNSQYFKYAFGEIVLVVVGILIALGINNWNEQRKESIKEKALLEKLATEHAYNLKSMLADTAFHLNSDMIPYELHVALNDKRSKKNDSIIQQKTQELFRSTIFSFAHKYLDRYLENSDISTSELVEELVELKDTQDNMVMISQIVYDYKMEKILAYLEDYYDSYSGSVMDIEKLRTTRFINRVVTLDNLEETQVDIYEDCLARHLKLD